MHVLTSLARRWNDFWFKREAINQLGIFRIALGIFVLLILVISFPNWLRFYGPNGTQPFATLERYRGHDWSLFALSNRDWWTWAVYIIALGSSVAVTIGFRTRLATVVLFLVYASMLHRNPFMMNGQDQVATMLLFLGCFAPLGSAYSLDAFLKRFRPHVLTFQPPRPPVESRWSLRLMQISIALIYLFSGPAKAIDDVTWRDGTAIYYVSLSDRWFRYPNVQLFHNETLSAILTYWTLAAEILFPLLVWFSMTRTIVLVAIAALHLSLMTVLSPGVFYFNLVMLVAFVLFVTPEQIRGLTRALARRRAMVYYDGHCAFCTWTLSAVKTLDAADRMTLVDFRRARIESAGPRPPDAALATEMHLQKEDGSWARGFVAFRYLVRVVPALYVLAPLLYFPFAGTIGPKVYRFIADRRFSLFSCGCGDGMHRAECPLARQTDELPT